MIEYIINEQCDLCDFEFWSGAKETAELINKHSRCEEIWDFLEDYINDSSQDITDTFINDFIWFDACDAIREYLGIDLYEDEDEEEEDEEEEDEDEEEN